MTNKGFNPLFVSALDILTGALGVFIILNFLNTRLTGVAPEPVKPIAATTGKTESPKPEPVKTGPGGWWRKPQPVQPEVPEPKPQPQRSEPQPETTTINTPASPTLPQDPVAVDLLKQTKGAVVILLQQANQSKASVEFMLRQGSRTWKPTRASKYQNNDFQYEKSLTYFYQNEIQPGTYEVLVRVKKGQRSGGAKPFSLYGKLIPPGQQTKTYTFGRFATSGSGSDWVPAGYLKISAGDLNYQSKLPAVKEENDPASAEPKTQQQSTPAPSKPSGGKAGKWG